MNEDETLSESVTGQNQPPPNREERDAAYSTGAGRKAAEVDLPEEPDEDADDSNNLSAPVGLQLETEANDIDMEL